MFRVALLTTAKTWKQPRDPLTDESVSKMCYAQAYRGLLRRCLKEESLNGQECLTRATARMPLQDSMLNERTQPQKDRYCMISRARIVGITETESRVVGCQRLEGGENEELELNGYSFSILR